MTIMTRLSRLFTADMHAVIDRMEEPDLLLKQALRDMEATLAASEQRCRELAQKAERLESARTRACEHGNELTEELSVCLDAGNDELARAVIRRRLALERQMAARDDELASVRRQLDEQSRRLTEHRSTLAELRQKADVFDLDDAAAGEPGGASISADDVEVALLKEKQRRART